MENAVPFPVNSVVDCAPAKLADGDTLVVFPLLAPVDDVVPENELETEPLAVTLWVC